MSAFRDQLRAKISRLDTRARDAARAAEDQCHARRERLAEADATAEAILNNVFLPLVDDFRAVVEGEGLLRDGCLLCETADTHGKRTRTRTTGVRKNPARPTVADFRRFLADRSERGLPELPPEQQLDEFERFLVEEHERQRLAAELAARPVPAWRRLVWRAADDSGLLYEFRLVAAAGDEGRVELWAEALRGAACDFRRDAAALLVELPRKSIAADGTDTDLARRWCARALSRSADALMAANLGPVGEVDPGRASDCAPGPAAVHAPLMTFPALDAIAFPAAVSNVSY
jgi:hypothetical protein